MRQRANLMETDLEQAGALSTAALAATQLEAPAAAAVGESHEQCLNCGAPLTGRYCAQCGQPAHLHRSLLHLLEEFVHSVLHFDAKGWRTLPLLIGRPGTLTRRYVDGQRVRYVSPLALFLFNSFLMFFTVSLLAGHGMSVNHLHTGDARAARAELVAEIERMHEQVSRARAALADAQRAGRTGEDEQQELTEAENEQRGLEKALQGLDATLRILPARTASAPTQGSAPSSGDHADSITGILASMKIETGQPWIDATVRRVQRNPELFLYRMQNVASKYLFMLIPISLPFLWLLFAGRQDINMYDHAVFSLYSLSFMALLIVACALLVSIGWAGAGVLAMLWVPPVHMFLQLRGSYALGIWAALWRTAALLAVAGTAFAVFIIFVMLVSLR